MKDNELTLPLISVQVLTPKVLRQAYNNTVAIIITAHFTKAD
jgi:hypothetical protein